MGDEEAKAHQIADDNVSWRGLQVHPTPALTSASTVTPSRNPRQNPRPSKRHPYCSVRSVSPSLARPVRAPEHLSYRLPLRQRARLPPSDTGPYLRSMSIKIINVHGERLVILGNENLLTHDFFFNNAP